MSSRIEDLVPGLRERADELVRLAADGGRPIRVTHTLRTWDEQAHLYAKGRTMPGSVVTNAPPGYSWHNFGRAFDVCFAGPTPYPPAEIVVAGKRVLNPKWLAIGKLGETLGLEWGGRWKSILDVPHFQIVPHGMTLALARAQHEAGPLGPLA